MKIAITKIPTQGLNLPLTVNESWFVELMQPYFEDPLYKINRDALKGHLQLSNNDGEVDVRGELQLLYDCGCARCGEDLHKSQKISWNKHGSPWDHVGKTNLTEDDEEADFSDETLNFFFYKNDEIDLDPILNDEIALSFPYNHYCEDVKACEARFQDNLKAVSTQNPTDPRWAALKGFKGK